MILSVVLTAVTSEIHYQSVLTTFTKVFFWGFFLHLHQSLDNKNAIKPTKTTEKNNVKHSVLNHM